MTQQIIEFLKQYQDMRAAQNRFGKSGDKLDQTKALQMQLKLDAAAPILLEVLNDDEWVIKLEDVNTEEGVIENILYDAEWCDLNKMNESIAFIKSKYVVKRNPDYKPN